MYGVALALTTSKPDLTTVAKQVDDWIHANKVCRHTLLSVLSNDLFDVYASYKNAKDIWDSFILKIYCRRHHQTKVRNCKLLPLVDDRRQRHQNPDKRISQLD